MKICLNSIFTVVAIILLSLPIQLTAEENSFKNFIDNTTYQELIKHGEIKHSFTKETKLYLIPNIPTKDEMLQNYKSISPDMGVEILKLYKTNNMDFSSPKAKLLIYNLTHSISSLKGVEYYSHTRKKLRTLFYDSYVVDSPENREKIPDPISKKIKPYDRIYIFQNDSTFGKNIFLLEYKTTSQLINIKIENLTTMKYLLLPLIPPYRMVTYMAIIPSRNAILFYGLSMSNFKNIIPVGKENVASFYYRLLAMYNWFISSIKNRSREFLSQ